MARIRTIKPSLWGDEKVARVCVQARLVYVGLVSMADDDGRFLASPAAVAGYLFPNDDLPTGKIKRWLEELAAAELVVLYESGGVRYGALPKFRSHQRISHPQASILPAPQGVLFG